MAILAASFGFRDDATPTLRLLRPMEDTTAYSEIYGAARESYRRILVMA